MLLLQAVMEYLKHWGHLHAMAVHTMAGPVCAVHFFINVSAGRQMAAQASQSNSYQLQT